jgi:hypothetical protein
VLWLGLTPSQQNYSWAIYSSLQNILAHKCFRSYFEEKTTKNCKNQDTVRECKLSCVNKD